MRPVCEDKLVLLIILKLRQARKTETDFAGFMCQSVAWSWGYEVGNASQN